MGSAREQFDRSFLGPEAVPLSISANGAGGSFLSLDFFSSWTMRRETEYFSFSEREVVRVTRVAGSLRAGARVYLLRVYAPEPIWYVDPTPSSRK